MQKKLYLCDIVRIDGQEVSFVSHAFGCLHCGYVGVEQHCVDALLFQSFDCLQI